MKPAETAGAGEWSVSRDALEMDVVVPDEERRGQIVLRHPTVPFERELGSPLEECLQSIATAYITQANAVARLDLPAWWLDALNDRSETSLFGWIPLRSRDGPGGRAIRSSRLRTANGRNETSRIVVLFAGERFGRFVFGSEFGLRVVANLARAERNTVVRITGLTASLPFGSYAGTRDTYWAEGGFAEFLEPYLERSKDIVGKRLGLDPRTIDYRGYRLNATGASRSVELRGRGMTGQRQGTGRPYEFLAVVEVAANLTPGCIKTAQRTSLVACAFGHAPIFPRDPASALPRSLYSARRPTRGEALDGLRSTERFPDRLALPDRVQVVPSPFVHADDGVPGGTKAVTFSPTPLGVVSDDMSALSAFRHVRCLFERLEFYGISPSSYFQFAKLPLKVYYRSGVRPGSGKNGQTVNGQVRPEGWSGDDISHNSIIHRPGLEIHLALGMLSTRSRPQRPDQVPHAEPLGFATDPRWIWHEIGHVLTMAAMGELEFRFAHSPGDALAAIVADPYSQFAGRGSTDTADEWRGLTFPWIFTPRRHDRSVLRGWSWSGTLGQAGRDLPDSERLRRKGYWSEQILSTTLFRLYCCLGGSTVLPDGQPDRAARKRASDFAVYLILVALKVLGDQRVVPANRVESFVAALQDADDGTILCPTAPDDGAPREDIRMRVGGCARKVIRWAFEAQGLFPADPQAITNDRGEPEAVDIFIADRRPLVEITTDGPVHHGPGTYVPVSLGWGEPAVGPDDDRRPAWFADPSAIELCRDEIRIRVGNRGRARAEGVTVDVWFHRWDGKRPAPAWSRETWTPAGRSEPFDVQPGDPASFAAIPFEPPGPGQYIVLAQATCPADRANTEVPSFACWTHPTPLSELVPLDNNLGLAHFRIG
jgi:hypothetical protein